MSPEITDRPKAIYWWIPLIFGVVFILVGFWILSQPVESFEKITRFIGVIILISGTTQLFFTLQYRKSIPGWGYQLLGDLFDLAIGVALVLNPAILLTIITLFVGFWLIANAISIFMRAAEARKANYKYWTWELALGIFLIVLALLFLWHPMALSFTLAIWTALAFIVLGVFRIVLTFRLRQHRIRTEI